MILFMARKAGGNKLHRLLQIVQYNSKKEQLLWTNNVYLKCGIKKSFKMSIVSGRIYSIRLASFSLLRTLWASNIA